MDIIYKVDWKEYAIEDLKRIDYTIGNAIYKKVGTYLVKAPKLIGKPLSDNLKGLWSYRAKDVYRVGYEIIEEKYEILIHIVGHRKDFYERFDKLNMALNLNKA